MKTPLEIEETQFENLVLNSKVPVLIDMMSPECIICKAMKERISEVAREFQGQIVFLQLDINNSNLWKKYDVRSTPTLFYFKDGKLVERQSDFPDKEKIKHTLNKLLRS